MKKEKKRFSGKGGMYELKTYQEMPIKKPLLTAEASEN
jgi:hypothetical protein